MILLSVFLFLNNQVPVPFFIFGSKSNTYCLLHFSSFLGIPLRLRFHGQLRMMLIVFVRHHDSFGVRPG